MSPSPQKYRTMERHSDRRQRSRSRSEGILFENAVVLLLCTRQRKRIRKRSSSCVVGMATAALFATFTWSSNTTYQATTVLACSPATVPPIRINGSKLVAPPLYNSFLVMRGGGDENKRAELDNETEETAADTPTSTDPSRESKTSWLSPLGSLLDLSHSVKVDASQEIMDDDKQEIGRGGALVKIKPPAPTRSWWLVSSFVSPFVRSRPSTVDNDDGNFFSESDAEYDPNKASRFTTAKSRIISGAKSVKRVWWVNSWADQLPNDQQDDEMLQLDWEEERNRTSAIADVLALSNSSDALQNWDPATEKEKGMQDRDGNSTEQDLTKPSLDSTSAKVTEATVQAVEILSLDKTPQEALAHNGRKQKIASQEQYKSDEDSGDSSTPADMLVKDSPMSSNATEAENPYVSSGYVGYCQQIVNDIVTVSHRLFNCNLLCL